MAFHKVKEWERADTAFNLPPLNDLSDSIFTKALIETLNLGKRGGESWIGGLNRQRHTQIYELLQEGKTVGYVSTYLASQKWTKYAKSTKSMRVIIGRFGVRLQDYFNDYGKNQSLAIINKDIPHTPDEYKLPVDFSNYPKEEGRAIASILRNAAKMEQRINYMMNGEIGMKYSNADLTKAMSKYHDMQREVVTLLRQNMWDGNMPSVGGGDYNASNYNPLFGNKKRVDRMIRATDTFLDLLEGKTIPLLKGKDGKFTRVGGKNGS